MKERGERGTNICYEGEVVTVRWFGSNSGEQIVQIPVDQIQVNPYQPRRHFDESKLRELCDSIRQIGIIQPIVVRRLGGVYELVAGERRWRAAMMAELKSIPSLVKEYTDSEVAQTALIENLQREDLGPLEEALAFQQLISDFDIRQEELALRLGKSQSTIANKLRLLNLSPPVRDLLGLGKLNERQARTLLRVKDESDQLRLGELAVARSFTVQQTEEAVTEYLAGQSSEQVVEKAKKRVRRFIPKDIRIFINTINETIKMMHQVGIKAEKQESSDDQYLTITVRIPRR